MIIISACLAGKKCRYDGCDKARADLVELVSSGQAIALCPEELGGLATPRPPSEQKGPHVLTNLGDDVTDQFESGAKLALDQAISQAGRLENIEKAILKTRSPMCGTGQVYDGSFSGKLVAGDGVFSRLLQEHNITIEGRD